MTGFLRAYIMDQPCIPLVRMGEGMRLRIKFDEMVPVVFGLAPAPSEEGTPDPPDLKLHSRYLKDQWDEPPTTPDTLAHWIKPLDGTQEPALAVPDPYVPLPEEIRTDAVFMVCSVRLKPGQRAIWDLPTTTVRWPDPQEKIPVVTEDLYRIPVIAAVHSTIRCYILPSDREEPVCVVRMVVEPTRSRQRLRYHRYDRAGNDVRRWGQAERRWPWVRRSMRRKCAADECPEHLFRHY